MTIAITGRLGKYLKQFTLKKQGEAEPTIFDWTAHLTSVYEDTEDDLLILLNNKTRLAFYAYEIDPKIFKAMSELEIQAFVTDILKSGFSKIGFAQDTIKAYFKKLGNPQLIKNQGRQKTAWLTAAGEYGWVSVAYDKVPLESDGLTVFYQREGLVKKGNSYVCSFDDFVQELQLELQQPVFDANALELEIELPLPSYPVKRRIIVDEQIIFEGLHEVIQKAFGWGNYHLYHFEIGSKKDMKRITLQVDSFFELRSFEVDAKVAYLKDFLKKGKKLTYVYDMGDYWEHQIKVCQYFKNYEGELPYLLSAEGVTPPEDCGGVGI